MKITNTQPGVRGVNTVTGTVLIDPKQTVEVEVYERERAHIDAAGWFEVEGDYTANPPEAAVAAPAGADHAAALKAKDDEIARLKAQIAGQGGDDLPKTAKEALALFSTEGVHVNTAKAKAAKFLSDKVPDDASKDVIVAKLEELAKAE